MVEVKQTTVLTHTEDMLFVAGFLVLQPDNNYICYIVHTYTFINVCFLV